MNFNPYMYNSNSFPHVNEVQNKPQINYFQEPNNNHATMGRILECVNPNMLTSKSLE